jgi:hypothetical protein
MRNRTKFKKSLEIVKDDRNFFKNLKIQPNVAREEIILNANY